ncbi:MAG: hypothetical protein HY751_09890 [Nitrospinae bacterium]|nr:hypothetical protein [Nitrospinota bacterium]
MRRRKTGLLVVGLAFVLLAVATARLAFNCHESLSIRGESQLAGEGFWRDRERVQAHPLLNTIPAQLPGPLDSWAGPQKKSIRLISPVAGPFDIEITLADSHPDQPPVIEIRVDDKLLDTFQSPANLGHAHRWGKAGFSFTVPETVAPSPGIDVSIQSVSGSWVTIDTITIKPALPIYLKPLVMFGWPVFILLAALYLTSIGVLNGYIKTIRLARQEFAHRLESSPPARVDWLWPGLIISALLIPSGGVNIFDGLPLSNHVETLAVLVGGVLIVSLAGLKFLQAPFVKPLIALALVCKIILSIFSATSGICVQPLDEKGQPVKTYEGVWSKGCYQAGAGIFDHNQFPLEHYNRLTDKPDPKLSFRFYFIPPAGARSLVLDTAGSTPEFSSITGVDKSSRRPGPDGGVVFDVAGVSAPGFVGGSVIYSWGTPGWRLAPYFLDNMGLMIHEPASGAFFAEPPSASLTARALNWSIGVIADTAITLILTIGALTALAMSSSRALAAWTLMMAIWLGFNCLPEGALEGSWLISLIPVKLASSIKFLALLAVGLMVRSSRLKSREVFVTAFLALFAFYGPIFLDDIGKFKILADGNDWRTFQRWANVIMSGNSTLSGVECPPTWNLPFAYFVAALHLIFGQSLFAQEMFDIYALAAMATGMLTLGRRWGLGPRGALCAGLFFLYAHFALGYYNYMGAGLTEHPSSLIIYSIIILLVSGAGGRWSLAICAALAFLLAGWRPNFLPWALMAGQAALSYPENRGIKVFLKSAWNRKKVFLAIGGAMFLWVLIFSFRNYAECDYFGYIAPAVKDMYRMGTIGERVNSVMAMATGLPYGRFADTDKVGGVMAAIMATGFLALLAGSVVRIGPLSKIPLGLSAFAWGGCILHFFFYNINAGYAVRWGIPLFPLWILGFFFLFAKRRENHQPEKSQT